MVISNKIYMKFRLIQLHFQNLNRTYLFCYSSPQGVKRPKQLLHVLLFLMFNKLLKENRENCFF